MPDLYQNNTAVFLDVNTQLSPAVEGDTGSAGLSGKQGSRKLLPCSFSVHKEDILLRESLEAEWRRPLSLGFPRKQSVSTDGQCGSERDSACGGRAFPSPVAPSLVSVIYYPSKPSVLSDTVTSNNNAQCETGPHGETCGGWRSLHCASCGHERRVYVPCQDRFMCELCSKRAVAKARSIYRRLLRKMSKPRMLVLTVKNGPDLSECLERLQKGFRRLRQRSFWKKRVKGGFYGLEVTRDKIGNWHCHYHIVFDGDYMPNRKEDILRHGTTLSEVWHEVTGDSYIVDVRLVKGCRDAALCETIKYFCEESETKKIKLSAGDIQFAASVLARKKLFGTFGELFGEEVEEENFVACPVCGNASWIPSAHLWNGLAFADGNGLKGGP